MKKRLLCIVALSAVLLPLCLTSCSHPSYKDGVYKAEAEDFAASGWKEILEITIENGEITEIDWDAIYKNDTIPIRKKQYSKSGLYGMMTGGASAEWYDQATAAEQFVLKNGIDALAINAEGYTDAVSSCTIHVTDFDRLLRQCLAKAKR